MLIGSDVIKKIKESVGELLYTYSNEISAVMDEEGDIAVSLPVKIKQSGPKLEVQIGIGFVKTRVKDSLAFVVDEQRELFGSEGVSLEVTVGGDKGN